MNWTTIIISWTLTDFILENKNHAVTKIKEIAQPQKKLKQTLYYSY